MKKVVVSCIAGLALMAMAALPVAACDGAKGTSASADTKASCGTTGTSAQMTSSKEGCASKSTGTSAQMTSSGSACGAGKTGSTGASAQLTAAEYAKMAGYEGKAELINMSIKGMTCGGCESSVSASLAQCPGVVKVISVNHKESTALVLVDPAKAKSDALTTAVTNKGYQAEIVPAVATTVSAADGKTCTAAEKAACAKTCTAAEKAACEAKGTSAGAVNTSAKGSN